MPREGQRARTREERARALSVGVVVVLVCFTTGLFMSLRGLGMGIGLSPAPAQGTSELRTVDGVVRYVQVDGGGHAVACSTTYATSSCSTVGVVLSRHRGSK